MNHNNHAGGGSGRFASVTNIVLIGFLAIAGYFLITEHRAHIATAVPYLPLLLLLACPFLHLFMHGSHGGHGQSRNEEADSDRQNTSPHRH